MIYDCFTFFNELDLLEIRLNILNEVVDRFVLVEATRTHQGHTKPLYFAENKQRFAPFLNKIIHIVVEDYTPVEKYMTSKDSDPMLYSWAYENFQRHSIIRGLDNLKDDDTLLVSDLDEIPSAEAVRKASRLSTDGKIRRLQLSQRSFFLNFCDFSFPDWEWGPIVISGKTFRDPMTYQKVHPGDTSNRSVLSLPSPHLVRPLLPDDILRDSGWHFSFMGGIEMVRTKLKNFAHTELSSDTITDEQRILKALAKNGDVFERGDKIFAVHPRKCLPPYIVSNSEKYAPLIFNTSTRYLCAKFVPKLLAHAIHLVRKHTPRFVKRLYFALLDATRTR